MATKQSLTWMLAALSLSVAGGALANGALKPEEMIKYRKATYNFMAWNMGKIKANLEGEFNAQQVQAAANAIAGIAGSGMGALYGPGTEKDIGDVKTRVKPEFFQEMPNVGKLATDFNNAAANLAKVAATGDKAAVQKAFGETGATCKACHDKYRME